MQELTQYLTNLQQDGFTVLPDIYSASETEQIISTIEKADTSKQTFRKSTGLFAVRQFLKEIPEAGNFINRR